MQRTPLILIAGGLGSGKTTLLRRLLSGEHGRIAVLVNEFGELGIDGEMVAGEHVDMVELTGGCVCCSLAGEFRDAVRELVERAVPERIVVETTGVAEADALVMDVEEDLPEAVVEAVVMLVDADALSRFPAMGHTERSQLECADLILINKTDLIDADRLAAVRERVEKANERARIVETVHADIDTALLLGEVTKSGRRPAGRRRPDAREHAVTTFHWRPAGSLARDCFAAVVAGWPRSVYRAKGRIVLDGEHRWLNFVAGRWHLEEAAPGEAGLVFIGPDVDADAGRIVADLEACRE